MKAGDDVRRIKLILAAMALMLVLAACQGQDISMQAPEKEIDSNVPSQTESPDEAENEAGPDSSQTTKASDAAQENDSEASESSEDVAKFPVRDEKIPPYELELIDDTIIRLDQFDGQVVMMTFFTTW